MKTSILTRMMSAAAAVVFGLTASAEKAEASVAIQAKVVASDATSSTVRFTLSGDLSGLTAALNLRSFLFIDFSSSATAKAALTAGNFTTFTTNTVGTSAGGKINTIEVRNNEGYYFDRIGFVFDKDFTAADTISANSVLELSFPTNTPLVDSDFAALDVYWGFPTFGTNAGRGTLAGTVTAGSTTPTSASISITRNTSGQMIVEFTGTLQSSPDLVTAFANVAGATSPYVVPAGVGAKMFYRATVE